MTAAESADRASHPIELVSQACPSQGIAGLDVLAPPTTQALAAPAFVLLPDQDPEAAGVLAAIRRHPSPDIYLKPVLLRCQQSPPADLARASDGAWTGTRAGVPPALRTACEVIRARSAGFSRSPQGDAGLTLRLLRFMASREGPFQPLPSALALQGHIYPALEPVAGGEPGAVLNALEVLEEQRVIAGELRTTAHECAHCGCAFLNFTENCPQCSSVDLVHDDLVHHFRCGYTAELQAFRHADEMVCPKCDRHLRHIGVDYDKPSSIFHCCGCTHDFQEPMVRSTCYQCGRESAPDNQPVRSIKSYGVTALGQNAAVLGLESLFLSVMERRLNLCPWEAFQMFLKVEVARIARYQRSRSSLLVLRLSDVDQLYVRLGRRADDVFDELAGAVTQILRRSDVITARHDALFLALLTETSQHQAEQAAERLAAGIGELLETNIGTTAGLRLRVEELDSAADPDETVQRLLG